MDIENRARKNPPPLKPNPSARVVGGPLASIPHAQDLLNKISVKGLGDLTLLMQAFPTIVYLPTHFALKAWFPAVR